jgi:hypothetical protein
MYTQVYSLSSVTKDPPQSPLYKGEEDNLIYSPPFNKGGWGDLHPET